MARNWQLNIIKKTDILFFTQQRHILATFVKIYIIWEHTRSKNLHNFQEKLWKCGTYFNQVCSRQKLSKFETYFFQSRIILRNCKNSNFLDFMKLLLVLFTSKLDQKFKNYDNADFSYFCSILSHFYKIYSTENT